MIEELRPFLARSRQRVKPKLAVFLEWLKTQQIEAGKGIYINRTNAGTSISLAQPRQFFLGDFHVSDAQGGVRVSPGFVNGIRPENNDSVIETPGGKFWVFVEVTVTEKGTIDPENKSAVMLLCDTEKTTKDKLVGRHPIAFVETPQIYQLSYFSLNHAYIDNRHLFVPA
jgi:hypothetical protein